MDKPDSSLSGASAANAPEGQDLSDDEMRAWGSYWKLLARMPPLGLADAAHRLFIEVTRHRLASMPFKSLVKHMVQRFLGWRLPEDFRPDDGISFTPINNAGTAYQTKHTPSGTNLFDATQAEAMVRYMLDELAPPAQPASPMAAMAQALRDKAAAESCAAPRQPEGPQDLNDEGLAAIRSSIEIAKRTGCSSITLEADEALRLIGQAERRRAQPADAATLGPEGEALRRALALIAREHGDGPGRGDMWAREIATAALAAKPVPDALLDEALDALRDALRDALLRYGCVGCALVMNSPDHPYYPAETMGYEAAMAFIRREAPKHKPQLDDRFHVPACKDDRARAVLRRSGRHEA